MERKTKRIYIRLTPDDEALFRRKAARYQTVSAMVRDAVRQFDDTATLDGILQTLRAAAQLAGQQLQPKRPSSQRTRHLRRTHATVLRAGALPTDQRNHRSHSGTQTATFSGCHPTDKTLSHDSHNPSIQHRFPRR